MEAIFDIQYENLTTIPYEDLSKWEVGKAVIKDAVNRWEPYGFLCGITNETKKEMLAVTYYNIAHDIIFENERVIKIMKRYNFNCAPDENDTKNHPLDFETSVFPVLRRVICGVVGKSDGEDTAIVDTGKEQS